MRRTLAKSLILSLLLTFGAGLSTSGQAADLAPNIPLDSPVYEYVDKLSGLGYLADLPPGAKPYTRAQAAKWLQEIEANIARDVSTPAYVRAMTAALKRELAPELAAPSSGKDANTGLALKELALAAVYYDGDSLPQHRTQSTYQPLNINNNGYRYGQDVNGIMTLRLEGRLSDRLVASISPRVSLDKEQDGEADLAAGYVKAKAGIFEIQAGKDPMWWGQGQRGTLALSSNAEANTGVKIATMEPRRLGGIFKPFGSVSASLFIGQMEDDRTDIDKPAFVAMRKDFFPGKDFTFGLARTSIVGGEGRSLHRGDYWDFLTGQNADKASDDKWNSIAGLDWRWRVNRSSGLQLYGELYGEDQATGMGFIPTPSKVAGTVGVYLPRLTKSGDWDALLEWAHTSDWWYSHWVYTDGYTYKGDIIGDAMGHNASRYYARLGHYTADGSRLALHAERVVQDLASASPQKITAVWLTWRRDVGSAAYMEAMAGVADIANKDYSPGKDDTNYIAGLKLVKRY